VLGRKDYTQSVPLLRTLVSRRPDYRFPLRDLEVVGTSDVSFPKKTAHI